MSELIAKTDIHKNSTKDNHAKNVNKQKNHNKNKFNNNSNNNNKKSKVNKVVVGGGIGKKRKRRDVVIKHLCKANMKRITGFEKLASFTKHKALDLSEIELESIGRDAFYGFKLLNQLNLSNNNLTDLPHNMHEVLISLTVLNLSHNKLTSEKLSAVFEMKLLNVVNLSFNNITHINTKDIDKNNCIKALILNNNMITSISNFFLFQNVNTLILSHNQITSIDLPLSSLPLLMKLSISHNNISIFPDVSKCRKLKEIRIAFNKIDYIHSSLHKSDIVLLDISHNEIDDWEIIERVSNSHVSTSLRHLACKGNEIAKFKGEGKVETGEGTVGEENSAGEDDENSVIEDNATTGVRDIPDSDYVAKMERLFPKLLTCDNSPRILNKEVKENNILTTQAKLIESANRERPRRKKDDNYKNLLQAASIHGLELPQNQPKKEKSEKKERKRNNIETTKEKDEEVDEDGEEDDDNMEKEEDDYDIGENNNDEKVGEEEDEEEIEFDELLKDKNKRGVEEDYIEVEDRERNRKRQKKEETSSHRELIMPTIRAGVVNIIDKRKNNNKNKINNNEDIIANFNKEPEIDSW